MSLAKPSSLNDFEPLRRAERLLWQACVGGHIAKVGLRRPEAPSPDVTVRASFLAFLACGGGAGAPVNGRRIELLGAWVTGRLALVNANVPLSLWMYRCAFERTPLLDGARVVGSLSFADCVLPGLRAEAARIDGELALNAGTRIAGNVRVRRARIGRDFDCERLNLRGDETEEPAARRPLVGDGACIGGDLRIGKGFDALGEVSFVGASVAGDLHAGGARLSASLVDRGLRGQALRLDRIAVAGDAWLDAGFTAAGGVGLRRARIGGDLDARGAEFDRVGDATWGDGAALDLERARIGGSLVLCELKMPLLGARLAGARAGALVDDTSSWGERLVLDEFSYRRFADGAPVDAPFRLEWLNRQEPAHLRNDWRPEPWRRAIKVLHRMGHEHSARRLAVAREWHLRRIGRIGIGRATPLRWLIRQGHALYGVLTGFGHQPWRLAGAAAVAWLTGALVYGAAAGAGAIVPAEARTRADAAGCDTETAVASLGAVPCEKRPAFSPLLFSLERTLPVLDLRQQQRWSVAAQEQSHTAWPWLLGMVGVVLAGFGWLVAGLALLGLSGLTNRDRAQ